MKIVFAIPIVLSLTACSGSKDTADAMKAFVAVCNSKVGSEMTVSKLGAKIKLTCSDMGTGAK